MACTQAPNERARKVAEDSRKYLLKREGVEVVAPENAIASVDDALRAASLFRQSELDGLVIQHGSFSPASLSVELVCEAHVPVAMWGIPEAHIEPNPLNCGSMTSLLSHAAALTESGCRFTFVHGLPDVEEARRDIDRFVRTAMVRRALRFAKVVVIGHTLSGCPACHFDESEIRRMFGIQIQHVDLSEVFRCISDLGKGEVDDDLAELRSRDLLLEGCDADALRRSCAAHAAVRKIVASSEFVAVAMRCCPEMLENHKLGICAVGSRLTDAGIPASCETDVNAALTMLVQHLYTGRPPFFADWIQRDEKTNQVLFWHCGNAPASLVNPRFEPRVVSVPRCKDSIAFDFPLKTGEVTIARLQQTQGRCKMLIASGRAVETPPSMKGTYVNVKFEPPVRRLLDSILRHGFPQHFSIVYEDIGSELLELAGQLGIEAIMPERRET